jgi:hypothetical protein
LSSRYSGYIIPESIGFVNVLAGALPIKDIKRIKPAQQDPAIIERPQVATFIVHVPCGLAKDLRAGQFNYLGLDQMVFMTARAFWQTLKKLFGIEREQHVIVVQECYSYVASLQETDVLGFPADSNGMTALSFGVNVIGI